MSSNKFWIKKNNLLVYWFVLFCFTFVNGEISYAASECDSPRPEWLFCEDFEVDKLSDTDWFYNSEGNPYFPSCTNACAEVTTKTSHSGSKSVRAYVPAGNSGASARGYQVFEGQEEIYISYYIRWQENPPFVFNSNRASHQTYIFAGTFNNPMNTDLTFYLDTEDVTIQPRLVIKAILQEGSSDLYISYPNEAYGSYKPIPWNIATPAGCIVGNWYKIEIHLKMNSFTGAIPNPDGIIRLWVDGTLVTEYTDAILRGPSFSTIKFKRFLFGPNYPPSGPPQGQDTYWDDILITKGYPLKAPVINAITIK
ncbi:MAG: polysaccharide lyase [Candidatus Thiodiazotropha sp. (ex Epidulcina cf. delphinae)]|nr:polysaccharide lyase [Candidatus Thiodiazotropha sp. (ex Epidulcina cf. delphinae)]